MFAVRLNMPHSSGQILAQLWWRSEVPSRPSVDRCTFLPTLWASPAIQHRQPHERSGNTFGTLQQSRNNLWHSAYSERDRQNQVRIFRQREHDSSRGVWIWDQRHFRIQPDVPHPDDLVSEHGLGSEPAFPGGLGAVGARRSLHRIWRHSPAR